MHEKSTSYCGKYLWHEFEYSQQECTLCNLFSIRIKDYKNGEIKKLRWAEFKDILNSIESVKK